MAQIGEPPEAVVGGLASTSPPQAPGVPRPRELDIAVEPSIAAGRRARYGAVITNRGSQPIDAQLSVVTDKRLRPLIVPSSMTIAPGESRDADVLLRPRRPQLLRREQQHEAQIRVRGSAGSAVATRRVIFVQQRALSLLALALLLPAAAGAAYGALQLSKRATVPSVEGAPDVATAERALRKAGLKLDPRLRSRTTTAVAPGSILDQIPDAGSRVKQGERVTLLVAVGSKRAVTPALDGQTPARAAVILRAAGLVLGPALPEGLSGRVVVASQLPAAGARVPTGTGVTIFLRALRSGEVPGAAAAAPAAGAPATTEVPAIEGRDVTEYARAVAAAGLVPRVLRSVGVAPVGTLVEVKPRPGVPVASGERVRLLVSAGVPQLAFDTGEVLQIFDPRLGRIVREASPPAGDAVEPSWSPDGRRVLYRVGNRLLLVSARLAGNGRIVYSGPTKYAAATFAPAPSDGVVALVRRTGGDGDLCFARVGEAALRPRCTADRRWDLGRQISWRHGGRELLVFGVRRGQPGRFGMLRYKSSRAFSTNPADWRGELVTDTSARGRGTIAASYSPSGDKVALVTNIGLPRFQLQLTSPADLRDPSSPALPARACEVAWRPDGGELSVVQSDDDCTRTLGQLVRVNPNKPRAQLTVTSGGRHPVYQPFTYAGPKGVS